MVELVGWMVGWLDGWRSGGGCLFVDGGWV